MRRVTVVACGLLMVLFASSCGAGQPAESPPPSTATTSPTRPPTPTPTREPTKLPTARATASPRSTPHAASADATYAALLARAQKADPTLDFMALRMAYVETTGYDPYGFDQVERKADMYTALGNKDYEQALALADQILEQNYLSPDAHLVALNAHEGLGHTQDADLHRYFLNGLVTSIMESGDGKSPETAFIVVLIEEEYMILSVLGVRSGGQRIAEEDGHSYDVFEGILGETDTQVTVYFNIDIPFQWLANSFGH